MITAGVVRRCGFVLVLAGVWLLPCTRLAAQGAKVSSPVELARAADQLKPGQWVWAPAVASDGPVLVYVDLSRQRVTVYRNGIRIGVSTISSGKKKHGTPTGVFTILQKKVKHNSNLYNSAPMPYMQRLTWDGIALHAGHLPGYAASHGCIRLPYNFAQQLYSVTKSGTTVVVAGDAVKDVETTEGSLLAPIDKTGEEVAGAKLGQEEFRWEPEKALSGPLTIIVSKVDQRIVVLRNGVEIGRSKVSIHDADQETYLMTRSTGADGRPDWIFAGLPGNDEKAGHALDDAMRSHITIPHAFYDAVLAEVVPGSTLLVTMSSVKTQPVSDEMTILDGVSAKQ